MRATQAILALASLSVVSAEFGAGDNAFPDCVNGPLKNNLVCDPKADYMARAQALVDELTLSEVLANLDDSNVATPRLGLAAYNWWSEALHGLADSPGVHFNNTGEFSSASQFPNGISLGAAFDDSLYAEIGKVILNETRAFNNHNLSGLTLYSPINVNPFKDPRWGRGQEVPGEDPLHISHYARALVPAVQGSDSLHLNLVTTCKHFLAYDLENWHGVQRYGFNAIVNNQDLVEYYLPSFKACIRDAKGASVMTSYNAVNGVPTSASALFVNAIARQRWGFDKYNSFVTSDCDAVANAYDSHHYDASYAAAAGQSINAGVDLDCGTTYTQYLGQAINQSITNEAVIRRASVRLYGTLVRLGYFDSAAGQPLRSLGWEAVNTPYARDLTYRAAVEGIVLLKNNDLLPLSPSKYKSVALVGPWANNTGLSGIYSGKAPHISTILEGLTNNFKTVNYQFGTNISSNDTSNFAAALAAARKADVVIYAGGLDTTIERETIDRTDLNWPGNQLSLITQLAAVGKPFVVLQIGGGQVDNTQLKSSSKVGAIVWPGYPGQSGGQAIADILSGKKAPAGRLPLTQYPASYADAVAMTDMNLRPGPNNPGRTYKWYTGTPVYDFGHGLHYTTFKATLSGAAGKSFDIQQAIAAGSIEQLDNTVFANITAAVSNTGKVTSDYVAALYVSSTNGPTPYPKRALVAYQRLHDIKPGQTVTATLPLTVGALSRVEANGDINLYPGKYTLTLDNPDVKLAQTTVTLTGSLGVVESWKEVLGNATAAGASS